MYNLIMETFMPELEIFNFDSVAIHI